MNFSIFSCRAFSKSYVSGVFLLIVFSAHGSESTTSVTMDVQQGISLSCTDLNFGAVAFSDLSTVSGTDITVDPDGSVTSTSADVSVSGTQAASCTFSGADGISSLDVFIDSNLVGGASPAIVSLSGPGASLEVTDFVVDPLSPVGVEGSGEGSFSLGGLVSFPNNLTQSDLGTYSGQMTVSVADSSL